MTIRLRRREFIAGLGGAAVSPLAARAQQPSVPVIGFLGLAQNPNLSSLDFPVGRAFLQGLAEAGYVPGRNLAIEVRGANFNPAVLPRLAADPSSSHQSAIPRDVSQVLAD